MTQVKTAVEYAIAERDALKRERDALIVARNKARIERDVAVTRAQRHDFLQRQVRDLKDMLESARKAERVWEGPFLKKIAELDDELIALKSERDAFNEAIRQTHIWLSNKRDNGDPKIYGEFIDVIFPLLSQKPTL